MSKEDAGSFYATVDGVRLRLDLYCDGQDDTQVEWVYRVSRLQGGRWEAIAEGPCEQPTPYCDDEVAELVRQFPAFVG
jgi:hypothetical protein